MRVFKTFREVRTLLAGRTRENKGAGRRQLVMVVALLELVTELIALGLRHGELALELIALPLRLGESVSKLIALSLRLGESVSKLLALLIEVVLQSQTLQPLLVLQSQALQLVGLAGLL